MSREFNWRAMGRAERILLRWRHTHRTRDEAGGAEPQELFICGPRPYTDPGIAGELARLELIHDSVADAARRWGLPESRRRLFIRRCTESDPPVALQKLVPLLRVATPASRGQASSARKCHSVSGAKGAERTLAASSTT
jgi:hypothetical protein